MYFSVSELEKKPAELARDEKFIKLKGVLTEEQRKEREEMKMRKEGLDTKIKQLDNLIKMKEDELRELEKEVKELEGELLERVVMIEKGMIS